MVNIQVFVSTCVLYSRSGQDALKAWFSKSENLRQLGISFFLTVPDVHKIAKKCELNYHLALVLWKKTVLICELVWTTLPLHIADWGNIFLAKVHTQKSIGGQVCSEKNCLEESWERVGKLFLKKTTSCSYSKIGESKDLLRVKDSYLNFCVPN